MIVHQKGALVFQSLGAVKIAANSTGNIYSMSPSLHCLQLPFSGSSESDIHLNRKLGAVGL